MSDRPEGPYRVVELSTVTDESIQDALNEAFQKGLGMDAVHFVMREGTRRPSMAFLVFTEAAAKKAKKATSPRSGDRRGSARQRTPRPPA